MSTNYNLNTQYDFKQKRFLDTSEAIALGSTGILNLDYKPVATSYTLNEIKNYGINCTSIIEVFSPSWSDFGDPKYSGTWGNYYEYQFKTLQNELFLQVWNFNRPFGPKAPCGCDATVMIVLNYEKIFYICESVAKSDADFSNITGILLYPQIYFPKSRDKHLGIASEFIWHKLHNSSNLNNLFFN